MLIHAVIALGQGWVNGGKKCERVSMVVCMKHITFGDKSLLIGDDAADAVLKYAAKLATGGNADTVEMRAISSDGNEVIATFLLGPGVTMMAETTNTTLPEPDNAEAMKYMQNAQKRHPVMSAAEENDFFGSLNYDYECAFNASIQHSR
jgi:hypothetical protein